jgi:hypothetical protein
MRGVLSVYVTPCHLCNASDTVNGEALTLFR